MLLARLQGEPVGGRSVGVLGDPDEAARQLALQLLAHREVSGVRTTEAHRHAEPLRRPGRDVGAERARRWQERRGQQVLDDDDERAGAVRELRDWQQLRDAGSALKWQVTDHLPELLEQLEASVQAAGGQVHWARDAEEAGEIVTALALERGARQVLKIKSMATQEIGLNETLEHAGIAAIEKLMKRKGAFDHILLETTGLADPGKICM